MQVGDRITVTYLAEKVHGIILQVEKYRSAYILVYSAIPLMKTAIITVFPELPEMPSMVLVPELYSTTAWLEWEDHIWPVPVGIRGGSRAIEGDPLAHAKAKIDHIYTLREFVAGGLKIIPGTDYEYVQWKKWWPG